MSVPVLSNAIASCEQIIASSKDREEISVAQSRMWVYKQRLAKYEEIDKLVNISRKMDKVEGDERYNQGLKDCQRGIIDTDEAQYFIQFMNNETEKILTEETDKVTKAENDALKAQEDAQKVRNQLVTILGKVISR